MKKSPTWKLTSLSVKQIEAKDTPFDWFPNDLIEKERNSLFKNGIQLPILVYEVLGSRFHLIDGFKRFSLLTSEIGVTAQEILNIQVPCLVVPSSVSLRQVVMIRLETLYMKERNYSGYRVCSLLKFLRTNGFKKIEIVNDILPKLGIKSSMRLFNQLTDIQETLLWLEEDENFQLSNSIKNLACEELAELQKFSRKDISTVIEFAEKMCLRGRKWIYVLQNLDEASKMQKTSVSAILEMNEIQEILSKKNIQVPVRYKLINQKLNSLRFPELNFLTNEFLNRRNSLKLPQRIFLECDKFFEEDYLTLTIETSSVEELRKQINYLDKITSEKIKGNKKNSWEKIFTLLKED